MSVTLATAWRPRGELPRFQALLPRLRQTYDRLAITLPPEVGDDLLEDLAALPGVLPVRTEEWGAGRYLALALACQQAADIIHYVDFDRLLHWVETRPEEWREAVETLTGYDCVVFGRTAAAYATHPQALVQTEALSNQAISYMLGLGGVLDVSAGSKAFSRAAAEFLVANSRPGRALGTDGEWLVLLRRAGYAIAYRQVDGLDWESADRYQESAASPEAQRDAAQTYDRDPAHWQQRVAVANEILQAGLEAASRPLVMPERPDFDFGAVFDVEDYMYFYSETLTDELSERQTAALVSLLDLQRPARILDLACGFGRHANRLAALGHQVTGIDLTPGFLDIARQNAALSGVTVDYQQGDMRNLGYQEDYDCVLLLFTAFGYFDDDVNQDVLRRIGRALRPGGKLIFDTHNRDVFLKGFQPAHVTEKNGDLMIDLHRFETAEGRMYNRRLVIRNGLRREKPFFVRMYNPTEITMLLRQAGLEPAGLYGSWDAQPLSTDSRRMIVVARKPSSILDSHQEIE